MLLLATLAYLAAKVMAFSVVRLIEPVSGIELRDTKSFTLPSAIKISLEVPPALIILGVVIDVLVMEVIVLVSSLWSAITSILPPWIWVQGSEPSSVATVIAVNLGLTDAPGIDEILESIIFLNSFSPSKSKYCVINVQFRNAHRYCDCNPYVRNVLIK